jgi:hypothetical protein
MAFATVHDRYSEADIAGFYAAGLWRPETFVEVAAQQADRQPDKVFVTDGTTSLTYRELADSALALAAGLRRLGVSPGDRVSVQIPSWAEFTQISLALSRIGAIMVPIMPIYRRDDVGYVLQNAGVRTAITCGPFRNFDYAGMYAHLRPDCPGLRDLVVVRPDGSEPAGAWPLEGLFAGDPAGPGELGPDRPPERLPAHLQHLRLRITPAGPGVRLRPDRYPVQPVAGYAHHRADHGFPAAAHARRLGAPDGGVGAAGRPGRHRQIPHHGGGHGDDLPANPDGRVRPRPA